MKFSPTLVLILVMFLAFPISSMAQSESSKSSGNKVGEIQEGQTGKYKRRFESLNLNAFGIGPFGSTTLSNDKTLLGLSYGKVWEASDIWDIRADALGVFGDGASYFFGGFGPSFILSADQIAPFVGFELGLGGAYANSTSKSGFAFALNGGLKVFRLADTQLEVLGTYTKLFSEDLGVYGLQLRLMYQ